MKGKWKGWGIRAARLIIASTVDCFVFSLLCSLPLLFSISRFSFPGSFPFTFPVPHPFPFLFPSHLPFSFSFPFPFLPPRSIHFSRACGASPATGLLTVGQLRSQDFVPKHDQSQCQGRQQGQGQGQQEQLEQGIGTSITKAKVRDTRNKGQRLQGTLGVQVNRPQDTAMARNSRNKARVPRQTFGIPRNRPHARPTPMPGIRGSEARDN